MASLILRPRRLLLGLFLGGLLLALSVAPAPAQTPAANAAPLDLQVDYKFTAIGLKMGELRLRAHIAEGRYWATSYLRTGGLAELFFKSRYNVIAVGRVTPGASILPSRYDSDFTGKKSSKLVSLVFDGTGLPQATAAQPTYGQLLTLWPVSDDAKRGSVDPMSAWIHFLTRITVADGKPCGTAIPVFDGRRRYDLDLDYRGTETVRIKKGKIYKGPAHRCAFLYKRIEGFKEKEMGEDALPIPPLEAWIAPMTTPQGAPILVPLRVEADAPLGKVKLKIQRLTFSPARDTLLFTGQARDSTG